MKFAVAAPLGDYAATVAPLRPGPFVIAGRTVVGQWGLIPPRSNTRTPLLANGQRMSTNNARTERMATAPTYREAWTRGRRCLIPADSYDEPNWTSGKNVWWRFRRADGEPWALAGLWSEWTDPQTGEIVPSYTMLTQNCDGHPLLGLMHKPSVPPDKRSVVPIEREDWQQWLAGTPTEALALIRVPDASLFSAGPAQEPRQRSIE